MATEPPSSASPGETATFLLVSDLHECPEVIDQLAEWLAARGLTRRTLEAIVVCGDLLSLHDGGQTDDKAQDERLPMLSELLGKLQRIHDTVLWIPGNHDGAKDFDNHPRTVPPLAPAPMSTAWNIHKRSATLVGGKLQAVGFGGSVPGYWHESGEKAWDSFPFADDAALDDDLAEARSLLSGRDAKTAPRNLLVVTHNPPKDTGTSFDKREGAGRVVSGGSAAIHRWACSEKIQAGGVALIHGHIHEAQGLSWLGKLPVINPGSLGRKYRSFALLCLRPVAGSTKGDWEMDHVQFHRLPTPPGAEKLPQGW